MTIQDAELDITGTIELLKGSYQFPDDAAVTDKKGTGKLTMGRKDLGMLNQIFFADISATGGNSVAPAEKHTIAATPTTIAPPGTGTFYADLGVTLASNVNVAFTKVTGTAAANQYSVTAGAYTFASADTGKDVLISYAYTTTSGNL